MQQVHTRDKIESIPNLYLITKEWLMGVKKEANRSKMRKKCAKSASPFLALPSLFSSLPIHYVGPNYSLTITLILNDDDKGAK